MVRVSSPSGKRDTYEMDGVGRMTRATGPRPGGSTYTTSYTQNNIGKLVSVSMPRDGLTQTQSFTDEIATRSRLLSFQLVPPDGSHRYFLRKHRCSITITMCSQTITSCGAGGGASCDAARHRLSEGLLLVQQSGCLPRSLTTEQPAHGLATSRLLPNAKPHPRLVCAERKRGTGGVFWRTHGRYAQYLNARLQCSGHFQQNRFYSCPLDERHLWTAIRYVGMNAVRTGQATRAEVFAFSSAAAHLSGGDSARILDMPFWKGSGRSERWGEMLQVGQNEGEWRVLRKASFAGRQLGSDEYVVQCKKTNRIERAVETTQQGRIAGEMY